MYSPAIIGQPNDSYTDRPTAKALIVHGNKVLLLNDGLLPGGGIEPSETPEQALHREVAEEIGITISQLQPISTALQYRDFLQKRYVVHGFYCQLAGANKTANPRDNGERNFTLNWLSIDDALQCVEMSIQEHSAHPQINDTAQGALYNRMTTKELLLNLQSLELNT